MADIKFYKATSRGGLDPIDASVDSLHNRRSIVIDDASNSTLWIIHGSGAAKKTKASAEKNAETIQNDAETDYSIEYIDYEEADVHIDNILKTAQSQANRKLAPIPSVPTRHSSGQSSTKEEKADDNGPIIKEFQIAYYEEGDPQPSSAVSGDLIKEVLLKISSYVSEIDNIIKNRPKKEKANMTLEMLSKDILDLIYQR